MFMEWIRDFGAEFLCREEVSVMDPAQEVERLMLLRQEAMVEGIARGDSDIQKYYSGATVFITGGSGFLGKQLVEKLLRACDIKKIYLLLRPKKGMDIQDRLKEILEDPVYCSLRQRKANFASKIFCLPGDVSELRLGLSEDHWNIVAAEVNVIFHVAATTRFDESLRVATFINVRGTRETLRLAKECQILRSMVYVSTAYSHATADKICQPIMEQFYETPLDPETLINLVETADDAFLEELVPKLTNGWPNTYTFAKAVAEEQVRLIDRSLPVCVVRPSIVVSAHYEPAPGWLDVSCARSASGFLIGSGLGLLHVMQTTPSTDISLVPVDYVNNAIIAAAWHEGRRRSEEISDVGARQTDGDQRVRERIESLPKIYNVVMSQDNKLTWDTLREYCMSLRTELSMPSAVYLAYVFCVQSHSAFLLLSVVLHFVPALLADAALAVLGQERKFLRIYKKIYKLSMSLSYFVNTTYYLDGNNTQQLFKNLSEVDQKIFFFDMSTIDWFEFSKVWCIGVRKYIIKDGLKNTHTGITKQIWFKYINYVVLIMYGYGLWFILSFIFKVLWSVFSSIVL